jgi:hypothetical protein
MAIWGMPNVFRSSGAYAPVILLSGDVYYGFLLYWLVMIVFPRNQVLLILCWTLPRDRLVHPNHFNSSFPPTYDIALTNVVSRYKSSQMQSVRLYSEWIVAHFASFKLSLIQRGIYCLES